jgi:outer membrane usher protein
MKARGFVHVVLLIIMLVFVALFLSAFLWTCFHQPATGDDPSLIRVEPPAFEPSAVIAPSGSEEQDKETGEEPSSSGFGEREEVQAVPETPLRELPPPKHLLSFPHFPGFGWRSAFIKIPSVPTFTREAIVRPVVPDPPFMFEPMVMTEEEWDLFYGGSFKEEEYNDDFFADFFVVGEDAVIQYDDGFYYLGLYVNNELIGDIEVEFVGEQRLLNANELSQYVGPYITDAANQRLFGDGLAYISLEELRSRNVEARYDAAEFAVYLQFSLEDMPERTISITSRSINRREQYGISGAIVLDPAKFAVASSLSLYGMLDYDADFSAINQKLLSLSVSNRISTLGIGLNVYFSLSSMQPYFNPGTWNGFYDFVESSHRLSFGHVGTNLSNKNLDSYTNVGFTFEKNYAYGTERAKGNQFEYRIVLVEPSEVKITINGEEVFKRSFQAGTYRLRDFVFTQGANQIKITIIPDSHPEDERVEYVDMGYDYRLLGKGDSLYGFGFSVPRQKSSSTTSALSIPWFDDQYLSYHLDAFTATYYQQTGLTDVFTFTSELAFSPGVFSGMFNGVYATMVGTSQLQLSLGLDASKLTPSFSASLSHRYSGLPDSGFGTISGTLNHSIPAKESGSTHTTNTTLSLSYSGSFTENIRYTLSGNLLYNSANQAPGWSASFATGFSPFSGFSLSGSITANGSSSNPLSPTLSAQISGSYTFSPKLSANASTSVRSGSPFFDGTASSSAGMSWRPTGNDSVNLSLSGFRFEDPGNHSIVAAWAHSGELSNFSLRQQISNSYQDMTTTFTASTALAYADGAFGIGRAVGESFLLVKPVGNLKDSDISIARSLDSSPSALSRPLGSALYNSVTPNATNSIVVFSSGISEYSTGTSFVYELSPRSRQSFVARLDVEPSFTVSGVLYMPDGSPYIQYSSPVYEVILNAAGEEELIRNDSLYLFTDQEGRYIISEVASGTYLFDLQVDDLWYAVRFVVPDISSQDLGLERVLLLEDFWVSDPAFEQRIIVKDAFTGVPVGEETDVFGTGLAAGYDAEVTLEVIERIDEETFWTIIFPPFDERDFGFESFAQDGFVTEDDYAFDEDMFNSMIDLEATDPTAQQVVTAAP